MSAPKSTIRSLLMTMALSRAEPTVGWSARTIRNGYFFRASIQILPTFGVSCAVARHPQAR